jgi:hypothetical protein
MAHAVEHPPTTLRGPLSKRTYGSVLHRRVHTIMENITVSVCPILTWINYLNKKKLTSELAHICCLSGGLPTIPAEGLGRGIAG